VPHRKAGVGRVFHCHGYASYSLVVIDQINIRGVALLKAEDDPPIGTNGDTPVSGEVAPQRVQPESRRDVIHPRASGVATEPSSFPIAGPLRLA